MKRRRVDRDAPVMPADLATYVEADWVGDVDEADPGYRDLAGLFGAAFMRRVTAHRLWAHARREWRATGR